MGAVERLLAAALTPWTDAAALLLDRLPDPYAAAPAGLRETFGLDEDDAAHAA